MCLAMSNNGRWIAAGTFWGDVFVWNAKTYEKVFSHRDDILDINGVDFSPDSTRLVSASDNSTTTIWDIVTRKRVQTLQHDGSVRAAKYSPQGDRIATATPGSVRVWDSNDGRLLKYIPETVTPCYNTGLLWLDSTSLSYPTEKSRNSKHPQGQQSRNGQFPIATTPRASLYQSMLHSSHTQHHVPSHFGTR